MSVSVVNGYVCQSCSDVSLAQKGVNPAHAKDDPSSPTYDPSVAKADKAKAGERPAVTYGGQLAGLNQATALAGQNGITSGNSLGAVSTSATQSYRTGSVASITT